MNWEIVIYIFVLLISIFYQFSMKIYNATIGKNNPKNWHFKNEKIDKLADYIIRFIFFLIGSIGIIHILFFNK